MSPVGNDRELIRDSTAPLGTNSHAMSMKSITHTHTHATKEPQEMLDTAQTKERLGLSDNQLSRLRATRRISYYKRGGRIWYAVAEVERVLQAFEVPALRPVVELAGSEKG